MCDCDFFAKSEQFSHFNAQVFYKGEDKPVFFVASRGHHADIGGITPGSMPPHSKTIFEEGAVFKSFFLVKNGIFQEEGEAAMITVTYLC
jgi:5-oxoprolinase (ATP-hydrolysing)